MAETKDVFHEKNEQPNNINIYNQDGTISEERIILFLKDNEKPRGKDKISKFYTLIKMLLENGYSINENFIQNGEISNNGNIKEKLADAIKDNTHKSERETIFNKIKEETLLLSQSRQERQEVITPTQETQDKNDEILSETTAVNMGKAFEKIKDIDGYQKLLLIEKILNHYVYENSFLIVKGKNNTCIVMTENGEVQQDYTQTLQQYLNYKDFQKHLSFSIQTSIGEDGYDAQVDNICKKYNISLKYEDDKQKMLLISNITNHQKMTPQEKRLLLTAIEGGYEAAQEDVLPLVDGYREAMKSALENPEVQAEARKLGLDWSQANRERRSGQPTQFFGDLMQNIKPGGYLAIFILVIGSLFGKKLIGKEAPLFMNLASLWLGINIYEASGAGNAVSNMVKEHGNEITQKLAWTWETLTKHVGAGIDFSAKQLKKTASWWEFKNIKLNGDFIVEKTNFETLYKLKSQGNLKGLLKNGKEKISDGLSEKLEDKIQELYDDGINKFGNEQQFFTAIKDKSIIEVIVIVNTDTDAPAPEADAPAPEADAPAPEADAPAPEADAPAPEIKDSLEMIKPV